MATGEKRFEDFYEDEHYLALKNDLYNYALRRRAVHTVLRPASQDLTLEVGSGVSPVTVGLDGVVCSELSFTACQTLRRNLGIDRCVVADATRLPFKDGAFARAACSEVIEHVEDDGAVLMELARVLAPGGRLALTFPHRRRYFANDDRFIHHFRRYELPDVLCTLAGLGLAPEAVVKVLGPLDKLAMMAAVWVFARISSSKGDANAAPRRPGRLWPVACAGLSLANQMFALIERLDAALVPRRWAVCLLVSARKGPTQRQGPNENPRTGR